MRYEICSGVKRRLSRYSRHCSCPAVKRYDRWGRNLRANSSNVALERTPLSKYAAAIVSSYRSVLRAYTRDEMREDVIGCWLLVVGNNIHHSGDRGSRVTNSWTDVLHRMAIRKKGRSFPTSPFGSAARDPKP